MKALITGGDGQLAADLQALLGEDARSYSHDELDIRDAAAVARAIAADRPDVIVNCAAFHNVDACEAEHEMSWSVNVRAVEDLARTGVPLVHFSTNYVFDGRRNEPYSETDTPSPRSIYAITKLAGEHAALAYGTRTLVVRSAGLYGMRGSASKGGNFVQRMLARAREQASLTVVSDQLLQPTFTADLAAAVLEALRSEVTGVLHLTAGGACSWHEFTQAIVEIAGLDVPVEPSATTTPPGGADRPPNGVLTSARLGQAGLEPLRHWREGLADYMRRAQMAALPD